MGKMKDGMVIRRFKQRNKQNYSKAIKNSSTDLGCTVHPNQITVDNPDSQHA